MAQNEVNEESSRSSSYYSDRFSVSPGIQPMDSYRSDKKLLNQGIYEVRVNAMIPRPYSTIEILDTKNAVVARYSISSNTNTFKIEESQYLTSYHKWLRTDSLSTGNYTLRIRNHTGNPLFIEVELRKYK